jgi:hypothetical protein
VPSALSIPRRFQATALVALVGLTVVACESGRPTTPTSPTTPTTSTPPTINLAGTWAGTASVTYDAMDGGGGCSGPVTVTFAQSGSAVSATMPAVAGCLNEPFRFEGTLKGDALQGRIVFPAFTWSTSGHASEDHLTMAATNVSWDLRR